MRGGFNAILRIACPYATPQSPNRDGLPRSIKELEYSLTLRTLDTNAANLVAIATIRCTWLSPVCFRARALILALKPLEPENWSTANG